MRASPKVLALHWPIGMPRWIYANGSKSLRAFMESREISIIVKRKEAEDEQSRLEEQLRHADRLATIGQLAASMAHELNEPLSNILGFAQLAKKCPGLPIQAGQDIAKILTATLNAREVIRKILIFARQMPQQKSQVHLNHVVEECLSLLESRCAKDGIEVVRLLSPHLPEVFADPIQLNQVLVNVIINAVQAMPEGGRLTLQTLSGEDDISLVVDDARNTLEVVQRNLTSQNYQALTAQSVPEAVKILERNAVDLVITDLKMPGVSGLDLIRHVRENFKETEVMMITGYPTVEGAVKAVKTGAEEYLTKPFTDEELLSAVKRVVDKVHLRRAAQVQRHGRQPDSFGLIAESEVMHTLFGMIAKAASTSATVLISGESGTGKELIAAAEYIVGKIEGLVDVSVDFNIDASEARSMISRAVKQVDQGDGVLIMTDLFGGSPSTIAFSFLDRDRTEVITGVNLPMILTFSNRRKGMGLKELGELIQLSGTRSIARAKDIIKTQSAFKRSVTVPRAQRR